MAKSTKSPPAVHITLKLNVPVEQLKRIAAKEWRPEARDWDIRWELRGQNIGRLRAQIGDELARAVRDILATDYAPASSPVAPLPAWSPTPEDYRAQDQAQHGPAAASLQEPDECLACQ